jgi:hypothetical protein
LDAGFSALSGFAAGAAAVRLLDPSVLGVYALLFAAFGVASQIPAQLVCAPAEVLISHRPTGERLPSLRWSLRRAIPFASLASLSVALGALPFAGQVDLGSMTPMIVTAIAFTALSPCQDHVRKVLHISERSWRAATVSGVQFLATSIAIAALWEVGPLWLPFGAPALGNLVSAIVGFRKSGSGSVPPARGELGAIGRWLTVVGLATAGGRYAASSLAGLLAGAASLGYVEAARIVARPADVIATGLLAVLGPRIMVASAGGNMAVVARWRRTFYVTFLTVTTIYGLWVVLPWALNPFSRVFPSAFTITGLVAFSFAAQVMGNLMAPYVSELLGTRKEANLAKIEVLAQGLNVAVAGSAVAIGPFALPVGQTAAGAIKLAAYRRLTRQRAAPPIHRLAAEEDFRPPQPK